jgi:hypothetical protein
VTYLPPPYLPPDPAIDLTMLAPPELRRPARQASTLLLILSGLTLAVAAMFWLVTFVPDERWTPEQRATLQEMVQPTGLTLRQYLITAAVAMTCLALLFGGLGGLVRGGRRWAIILAIIFNGLMLIIMTIGVIQKLANPDNGGLLSAVLPIAVTALMMFLMQRLIVAVRAAGAARNMAAQWQLLGQPFDPNSYGFGFGAPLPPPPSREEKK